MAIVRAAVPFLSLLLILVLIHEFGHFLAAKAFGIKVLEFGIGFPPKAKTLFTKGGLSTHSTGCRSAVLSGCWAKRIRPTRGHSPRRRAGSD
ncbi:MAG: site-2 protease family protein [Dehalococcoidia bacterium]|nr:site-2 protease family protein [Dehalococcoidia bacterium]